jgi:LuxR family maltose regulon positive regulatory protein
MMKTGEITALNQFMEKLPEEVLHRHPYLSLAYAWSLIAARQLQLARYWLDEVRMWLGRFEKQTAATQNSSRPAMGDGIEDDRLQFVRAGLAICHSSLAMLSGDMEQAAEFYQQASDVLPEENVYAQSLIALDSSMSAILSGDTQKAIEALRGAMRIARQANNPFVLVIATGALADMQAQQGQLSKAWETLQRAKVLVQGPDGNPLPLAGLLDISLGDILLEQDLLEEAREYLERGCQVTQSMWYLGSLNGMISLTRLRQATGDIAGSQSALAEAERMAVSAEADEWDDAAVAATAVRLALLRDDLSEAELWWKKGGLPDLSITIAIDEYPYHIYEYLLLTQARFLMVKGQDTKNQHDLQQAAELLRTTLPAAERYQRVTSQIEMLILLAMAQSALGEDGAHKTLLRAMALGEPEGYRRLYLDEGWRLSALLRQCRSEQQESGSYFPSLAFIDSLLEDIQRAGTSRKLAAQAVKVGPATARLEDGFPICLSARELEVLKSIAEGKSNQDISNEFYLALNTVKRHAYNIFAKLEVSNRTQAVMKARQVGLIS